MAEIAVLLKDVSRFYKLYDSPKDRLREALHPFGKKLHRDFYALKNINLEVRKGEVLGIVGRNGSGKSTLLMIASRVIPPSSGQITVNGSVSAMLELGAGMNPDFDGIQNIYFGGIMLGLSRETMKQRMDEIIAFADIGEFIRQPLKTYSAGMKARLGFALAVSVQPEILIIDEVLAVGDELFRRRCNAKIDELIKAGCTVLFVSHSVNSIIEVCSRVILLDNGELILEGSPKLVTMNYQRLLFAAPGTCHRIREEILRLNRDENHKKEFSDDLLPEASDPGHTPAIASPPIPAGLKEADLKQEAFFVSGFVPKSTVESKYYDVDISDVHVQTVDGRWVNMLVMDEEYVFSFKVRFRREWDNVNFVMAIHGEKGQALSACSFPAWRKYIQEKFTPGQPYEVKCRFKCKLLPGTYFTTASVRHHDGEEMLVLNRIRDASAFKVLPNPKADKGGFFNLDQKFEIVKLEKA